MSERDSSCGAVAFLNRSLPPQEQGQRLDKLDAAGGEYRHAQEQHAVLPTADIGVAIAPVTVADGNLDKVQIEFGRA